MAFAQCKTITGISAMGDIVAAAQEDSYYEELREEFLTRATEKFKSACIVAVSLSASSDQIAVLLSHWVRYQGCIGMHIGNCLAGVQELPNIDKELLISAASMLERPSEGEAIPHNNPFVADSVISVRIQDLHDRVVCATAMLYLFCPPICCLNLLPNFFVE